MAKRTDMYHFFFFFLLLLCPCHWLKKILTVFIDLFSLFFLREFSRKFV